MASASPELGSFLTTNIRILSVNDIYTTGPRPLSTNTLLEGATRSINLPQGPSHLPQPFTHAENTPSTSSASLAAAQITEQLSRPHIPNQIPTGGLDILPKVFQVLSNGPSISSSPDSTCPTPPLHSPLGQPINPTNTLTFLNGDVLGGSLFAEHFHGKSVAEMLNVITPTLVAIGNHEYDYGTYEFEDLIDYATFPWVGENIRVNDEHSSLHMGDSTSTLTEQTINANLAADIAKESKQRATRGVPPCLIFDFFVQPVAPTASNGSSASSSSTPGRIICRFRNLALELLIAYLLRGRCDIHDYTRLLRAAASTSRAGHQCASAMAAGQHIDSDPDVSIDPSAPIYLLRVGVLSVCTQYTPTLAYPSIGTSFFPPELFSIVLAMLLKTVGCHQIFASTHLALSGDMKLAMLCRQFTKKMIQQQQQQQQQSQLLPTLPTIDVPSHLWSYSQNTLIDVIFGGHDHTPLILQYPEFANEPLPDNEPAAELVPPPGLTLTPSQTHTAQPTQRDGVITRKNIRYNVLDGPVVIKAGMNAQFTAVVDISVAIPLHQNNMVQVPAPNAPSHIAKDNNNNNTTPSLPPGFDHFPVPEVLSNTSPEHRQTLNESFTASQAILAAFFTTAVATTGKQQKQKQQQQPDDTEMNQEPSTTMPTTTPGSTSSTTTAIARAERVLQTIWKPLAASPVYSLFVLPQLHEYATQSVNDHPTVANDPVQQPLELFVDLLKPAYHCVNALWCETVTSVVHHQSTTPSSSSSSSEQHQEEPHEQQQQQQHLMSSKCQNNPLFPFPAVHNSNTTADPTTTSASNSSSNEDAAASLSLVLAPSVSHSQWHATLVRFLTHGYLPTYTPYQSSLALSPVHAALSMCQKASSSSSSHPSAQLILPHAIVSTMTMFIVPNIQFQPALQNHVTPWLSTMSLSDQHTTAVCRRLPTLPTPSSLWNVHFRSFAPAQVIAQKWSDVLQKNIAQGRDLNHVLCQFISRGWDTRSKFGRTQGGVTGHNLVADALIWSCQATETAITTYQTQLHQYLDEISFPKNHDEDLARLVMRRLETASTLNPPDNTTTASAFGCSLSTESIIEHIISLLPQNPTKDSLNSSSPTASRDLATAQCILPLIELLLPRHNALAGVVSCINGGVLRGDKYYEQDTNLTTGDILTELPFLMSPCHALMYGDDLLYALNQQIRLLPSPTGAFPHWSRNVAVVYSPNALSDGTQSSQVQHTDVSTSTPGSQPLILAPPTHPHRDYLLQRDQTHLSNPFRPKTSDLQPKSRSGSIVNESNSNTNVVDPTNTATTTTAQQDQGYEIALSTDQSFVLPTKEPVPLRVVEFSINKTPIAADKLYLVTATTFMMWGGDGLSGFLRSHLVENVNPATRTLVINDLVLNYFAHLRQVQNHKSSPIFGTILPVPTTNGTAPSTPETPHEDDGNVLLFVPDNRKTMVLAESGSLHNSNIA